VYSTCLFCNSALGRNESLEHFSVGRRLAFDPAKGRLWVVCPRCERWNLTPLESRWEAIEEAERAYRGMKLRVSTENIGLARLHEGLELVRVGAPLLPEFAAWRYGDQFGRRRRKYLAIAGAGITAGAALLLVPVIVGLSGVSLVSAAWNTTTYLRMRRYLKRICASVRDEAGTMIPLTAQHIQSAAFIRTANNDGRLCLAFPHGPMLSIDERDKAANRRGSVKAFQGYAEVNGTAATRALTTMLPQLNVAGGTQRHVRNAVDVATSSPDVDHLVRQIATSQPRVKEFGIKEGQTYLRTMSSTRLLALEIMLHQGDERRAMEGELRELEQRWRDAEAIASIADSLTLTPEVEQRLAALTEDSTLRNPRSTP
jgi:hypothetical protein